MDKWTGTLLLCFVRFTSDESVMNLGSEDKILEEASKIDEALVWASACGLLQSRFQAPFGFLCLRDL